MAATGSGQVDIVTKLLEVGADVNAITKVCI